MGFVRESNKTEDGRIEYHNDISSCFKLAQESDYPLRNALIAP